MERAKPQPPDPPEGDAARHDENGVLIVDVAKLREMPDADPGKAAPSKDSPGMPGNTGGTGEEHTEQD